MSLCITINSSLIFFLSSYNVFFFIMCAGSAKLCLVFSDFIKVHVCSVGAMSTTYICFVFVSGLKKKTCICMHRIDDLLSSFWAKLL